MSVSIISIAAGRIPAEMIADTASPAASVEWNAARCVVTASGLRRMRSVISVAIPSVPSEPMKAPSRSGPSGSSALPPSSTISPSGSTTVRPVTWLTVKPFLRQCAPPEFSATLPPIVQTCWLEGSGA